MHGVVAKTLKGKISTKNKNKMNNLFIVIYFITAVVNKSK
jgi:hypothetical protein